MANISAISITELPFEDKFLFLLGDRGALRRRQHSILEERLYVHLAEKVESRVLRESVSLREVREFRLSGEPLLRARTAGNFDYRLREPWDLDELVWGIRVKSIGAAKERARWLCIFSLTVVIVKIPCMGKCEFWVCLIKVDWQAPLIQFGPAWTSWKSNWATHSHITIYIYILYI